MSDNKNIIYTGDLQPYTEKDGLGQVFFKLMKQNGDAIFQIDVITGKEDSFRHALSRTIKTSVTMHKKGVKPEDIVAVCDYSHLDTCIPMFATLFLGATAAAVDNKLVLEDMTELLKKLKAKFIFTSSQAEEIIVKAIQIAQIDTQIVIFDRSAFGNVEFRTFLDVSAEDEKIFEPEKIENLHTETALILFSSGSTGLPKGVCFNHYSFLKRLQRRNTTGIRLLHFSGIYWISTVTLYFTAVFANYTLLIAQFDEDYVWNWIEKYKVHALFLSGVQSRKLIAKEEFNKVDTSSLKHLYLGGAKIFDNQMKELYEKLPHVTIGQPWGMTEICGVGLAIDYGEISQTPREKLYTTIGTPLKGVHYKIVDLETGKALGPNQPGELRLKSEAQMLGYFGQESSDTWDEDGYLKTGDMMYYDEDRYFYYVERIGEMFKCNNEHVYPKHVEKVFLTHPDVKMVVVVGLPNPEGDMHPAAMVVLNKFGSVAAEELRKYVEETMKHRITLTGGVRIVDDIPMTCSGKVKRRYIQKMLLERGH